MAVVRLTDWRKEFMLRNATEQFDANCTELSGVDYTALVKAAIEKDPLKEAAINFWNAANTFKNVAGDHLRLREIRPQKVDEVIIDIENYAVARGISKFPRQIRTRDHSIEFTWESFLINSGYRDFHKPLSYFEGCPGFEKIVEYVQRYSDSQNRLFEYQKNVRLLLDKYGSLNKLLADHPNCESWVDKHDVETVKRPLQRKPRNVSDPNVDVQNTVVDMTLINQTLMANKLASL